MWINLKLFVNRFTYTIHKMITNFLSILFGQSFMLVVFIILFVLSMSSFASARVLTKEEVANFMLNGYKQYTDEPSQTLIDNVNLNMGHWETIAGYTSTYENYYTICYDQNEKTFRFFWWTGSSTALNNQYSTSINWSSSYGYWLGKNPYSFSGTITQHVITYDLINYTYNEYSFDNGSSTYSRIGKDTSKLWLFTMRKLPANGNQQSALSINANTQKPTGTDLFAENYISSTVWEFDPIRNEYCTISGDSSNTPYYLVSKSFAKTYLGTFKDSYYVQSFDIYCRGWLNNQYQDVWELYYEDFINQFATTVTNDVGETIVYVKSSALSPNTVLNLYFTPNTPDLETYTISFYIQDSTTVINNGVIDIQASIENDPNYFDNVSSTLDNISTDQNYINIQDIMNNITDNSQVEEISNEYFGTSSQVATSLGYRDYSGDNPYGNVYLTILNGVRSVLVDSGNVTLTCTVHDQTFTFNSDDFQNPSIVLKVFTSSLCIFICIYTFYYLAFFWVHKLAEGDLLGLKSAVRSTAAAYAHWM